MAIVQPKSLVYRKLAAHAFMWFFLCLIMFPLLMIVAISFRQGNFSVGDVIPSAQTSTLDHWRLALGLNVRRLNLVPGAQLTYVKTDDGAVRLSVASEEATGFRDFVSEPFSDQDVLKANEEQPLVVLAYPESLTEDANVYDANEAAAMSKAFAEKLKITIGEGADAINYFIEAADNEGRSYTLGCIYYCILDYLLINYFCICICSYEVCW